MDDIWAPLAENQVPRTYAPGQLIYLQDTEADVFYYLLSGSAQSYISSPAGGERVLTTHHAGDLMGEASFFDRCPRVSSNRALTACRVVSVDDARLKAVFAAHPDLALPMLRYLARTVRMLSGHVDDMSFRPAEERLARWLLAQADGNGTVQATHEAMGAYLGASRVTVSRVLQRFSRAGWVRTGYGSVQVLDPKALEKFTEEGR